LLLASLLLSVAIEWVGMHLWWPELGPEHSRQMVRMESRFLDRNVTNSWVESKPVVAVTTFVSTASAALAESRIVTYAVDGAHVLAKRLSSNTRWRRFQRAFAPYLLATKNISQLYAIRLTVLCLAAPLFVLLLWVGLVDGLVQRDLRRWGGGRESAYVYHYAKRSNLVFVAVGAIAYLTMPISIHPAIILVPFATACAISVNLTASRFKKYL
jgi:integrating conjugative element membrane protein (TIGR03747 family)